MDAWVREILRCPACGSTLADVDAGLRCENGACALTYRIEEGIPVLLVSEGTPAAAGPDVPGPDATGPDAAEREEAAGREAAGPERDPS